MNGGKGCTVKIKLKKAINTQVPPMLVTIFDYFPQVLVSLSNTANTKFEIDVQGSTNLKLHVTSNLAVKSPIKVLLSRNCLGHVCQCIFDYIVLILILKA